MDPGPEFFPEVRKQQPTEPELNEGDSVNGDFWGSKAKEALGINPRLQGNRKNRTRSAWYSWLASEICN